MSVNIEDSKVSSTVDDSTSSTLFVGDLSYFCNEVDISNLFKRFGKVQSTQLKKGRSGDSLMHGFVEMETHEQAENARVAVMDQKFMGRKIRYAILMQFQ